VLEAVAAAAVAVALAAAMNPGVLRRATSTLPQDLTDPTAQAWQVAWVGHAVGRGWGTLWNANVAYPEPLSLAHSDSLLGYAPAALLGSGPHAAVLRYNVLFVLAFALASFGAYVLARQLGAAVTGAALAGVTFAYAPWRFAHASHLNILSSGGIPLALAMLARAHGWSLLRRDGAPAAVGRSWTRPAWALAGWCVAAWQVSLGFGLGVPFGYVLLVAACAVGLAALSRRTRPPAAVLAADLAGCAVLAATALAAAIPYEHVVQLYPNARRDVALVASYSPPLRGLVAAPATSWLWGGPTAGARESLHTTSVEVLLFPGAVLLALAAVGLVYSAWRPAARVALLAGAAGATWLALGTVSPGHGRYGWLLLRQLPGFDAIRTPGRVFLWTTLLLGLLAAGAVTAAIRAGPGLQRRRAAAALLVAGAVVEGVHTTPQVPVPWPPVPLRCLPAPILVLPADPPHDMPVMLWSTDGFPPVVNGSSGFDSPRQWRLRLRVWRFPDARSVDALRRIGVRSVLVPRAQAVGTPVAPALTASGERFGVRRTELPGAVLFTLPGVPPRTVRDVVGACAGAGRTAGPSALGTADHPA
jgi:hypothetical protein